jgi:DNA-binding response OmpR family regulator
MIFLALSSAILEKVSALLEKFKLKYQVVETGEDLLEKAKKQKPQLIILEKDLPLLDGFSATLLLKANDKTKDIPVITICKCDFPEEEKKARDCGADCLLHYPFKEDEFIQVLSKLLKKDLKPKD